MMVVYTRKLTPPKRSFFLFGPRGTGKTTWLKQVFPTALYINLLNSRTHFHYLRDPHKLFEEVEALSGKKWVVLDEIQRLPELLNEVHSLMNEHGSRYRFALTGSSARKLKRTDVNLLAGRAINRSFFPLVAAELNYDVEVEDILKFGNLPEVRAASSKKDKIDILEAYCANYLREEIQQEAIVKRLDSFVRFLEVSAIMNGQILNVANVARDAGVQRPTVQGYFQVLEDTLIGVRVPAWRKRIKVKEVSHPKFYLFDSGVVRALSYRLREPTLDALEKGFLLETWVLHELRAWMGIHEMGGQWHHWGTPQASEVDFIMTGAGKSAGIEVKAKGEWKREYGKKLEEMIEAGQIKHGFGVYLGSREMKVGKIHVYPILGFCRRLEKGHFF
ncbi:MAG: ATP-binding protein [Proteobacteria bacterium]|nr:ATP-binding protein [Pseudomonadota bacterium]